MHRGPRLFQWTATSSTPAHRSASLRAAVRLPPLLYGAVHLQLLPQHNLRCQHEHKRRSRRCRRRSSSVMLFDWVALASPWHHGTDRRLLMIQITTVAKGPDGTETRPRSRSRLFSGDAFKLASARIALNASSNSSSRSSSSSSGRNSSSRGARWWRTGFMCASQTRHYRAADWAQDRVASPAEDKHKARTWPQAQAHVSLSTPLRGFLAPCTGLHAMLCRSGARPRPRPR